MSTSNSRLKQPIGFMSGQTPKWRAKDRKSNRKAVARKLKLARAK